MEFIIKVLSETPKRRRKTIIKEIYEGTNYEHELIDDDKIKYVISDKLEPMFRQYLSKYKDIEI